MAIHLSLPSFTRSRSSSSPTTSPSSKGRMSISREIWRRASQWNRENLRLRLERFGDCLGHIEELAPDLRVGDRVVELDELDRLGPLKVLPPLPVLGADLGIVGPATGQ